MVQETKFTPGPWHTARMHPRHVCNKIGFKVAKCLEETKGISGLVVSREEAKANARLISAALELYKALEASIEQVKAELNYLIEQGPPKEWQGDAYRLSQIVNAGDAALAKARGEQ
jgi:hypothetical protein